jgi:hypothetical protein
MSRGQIGAVEVTLHILLTSELDEVSDNLLNKPIYHGRNNALYSLDSLAACTAGTWSFPTVKRRGRVADYPPRTSSAEVANGWKQYALLPSVPT